MGLHPVTEVVQIHHPVNFVPDNIPVTKELILSVRLSHAVYQVRIEEDRLRIQCYTSRLISYRLYCDR